MNAVSLQNITNLTPSLVFGELMGISNINISNNNEHITITSQFDIKDTEEINASMKAFLLLSDNFYVYCRFWDNADTGINISDYDLTYALCLTLIIMLLIPLIKPILFLIYYIIKLIILIFLYFFNCLFNRQSTYFTNPNLFGSTFKRLIYRNFYKFKINKTISMIATLLYITFLCFNISFLVLYLIKASDPNSTYTNILDICFSIKFFKIGSTFLHLFIEVLIIMHFLIDKDVNQDKNVQFLFFNNTMFRKLSYSMAYTLFNFISIYILSLIIGEAVGEDSDIQASKIYFNILQLVCFFSELSFIILYLLVIIKIANFDPFLDHWKSFYIVKEDFCNNYYFTLSNNRKYFSKECCDHMSNNAIDRNLLNDNCTIRNDSNEVDDNNEQNDDKHDSSNANKSNKSNNKINSKEIVDKVIYNINQNIEKNKVKKDLETKKANKYHDDCDNTNYITQETPIDEYNNTFKEQMLSSKTDNILLCNKNNINYRESTLNVKSISPKTTPTTDRHSEYLIINNNKYYNSNNKNQSLLALTKLEKSYFYEKLKDKKKLESSKNNKLLKNKSISNIININNSNTVVKDDYFLSYILMSQNSKSNSYSNYSKDVENYCSNSKNKKIKNKFISKEIAKLDKTLALESKLKTLASRYLNKIPYIEYFEPSKVVDIFYNTRSKYFYMMYLKYFSFPMLLLINIVFCFYTIATINSNKEDYYEDQTYMYIMRIMSNAQSVFVFFNSWLMFIKVEIRKIWLSD